MANRTKPLPDLCLLIIFDHLPIQTLVSTVPLVCTRWYQLQSPALTRRRHLVLMQRYEDERFKDQVFDELYGQQFTIRDTPKYLSDLVVDSNDRDLQQLLKPPLYSMTTLRNSTLPLSKEHMTILPEQVIHLVANRTRSLTSLAVWLQSTEKGNKVKAQEAQLCRLLGAIKPLIIMNHQSSLTSLTIKLYLYKRRQRLPEPVAEALNHLTGLRSLHLHGNFKVPNTPLTLLRSLRRFDFSDNDTIDQWLSRVWSVSSASSPPDHQSPPTTNIGYQTFTDLPTLMASAAGGLLARVSNIELLVSNMPALYCSPPTTYQNSVIAHMESCRSMTVTMPGLTTLRPLVRLFEPLHARLVLFKLTIVAPSDFFRPPPAEALNRTLRLQPLESVQVLVIQIGMIFEHHDQLSGTEPEGLLPLSLYFPRLQVLHLRPYFGTVCSCYHCQQTYYSYRISLNNGRGKDCQGTRAVSMKNACRDAMLANLWLSAPATMHTILYEGDQHQGWTRYSRPSTVHTCVGGIE